MSLLKSFPNRFGSTTEYWKIESISKNFNTESSKVFLEGFESETAKNNGAQPVDRQEYLWNQENFPFTAENIKYVIDTYGTENGFDPSRKIAYLKFKGINIVDVDGVLTEVTSETDFSDATDV